MQLGAKSNLNELKIFTLVLKRNFIRNKMAWKTARVIKALYNKIRMFRVFQYSLSTVKIKREIQSMQS